MALSFDIRRNIKKEKKGVEIFEITPVILGGSSEDSKNKTILSREQHIQACKYWNKIILDMKQ